MAAASYRSCIGKGLRISYLRGPSEGGQAYTRRPAQAKNLLKLLRTIIKAGPHGEAPRFPRMDPGHPARRLRPGAVPVAGPDGQLPRPRRQFRRRRGPLRVGAEAWLGVREDAGVPVFGLRFERPRELARIFCWLHGYETLPRQLSLRASPAAALAAAI